MKKMPAVNKKRLGIILTAVIAAIALAAYFGTQGSIVQTTTFPGSSTETVTVPLDFCSTVEECEAAFSSHGATDAQIASLGIQCIAGECTADGELHG